MFGKGGSALSTWIKEFCELVFLQTIQAFIYAMAISFIVVILQKNIGMSTDDHNTAVGIISVVALTAIFKVEDLARKVFGFGQTKADHGSALASLAKTKFALDMGKSVLDNGRKIIGGAGAVIGAHSKGVKARKNYLKDLEAYNKDNGINGKGKTNNALGAAATSKNNSGQKLIDSKKRDQRIALQNSARAARIEAQKQAELRKRHIAEAKKKAELARGINDKNADGTINGDKRNQKLALMEQAQAERKAAAEASSKEQEFINKAKADLARAGEIDDTLVAPMAGNSSSGGGGSAPSLPKDYHQKMRQFESNYKKELDNINKQKREGYKNIAKGVLESGAATVGFTTGAIIGGADGNLVEAIQGGVAGAGLGDRLATGAVDMTTGVMEFAESQAKMASELVDEYKTNVVNAYNEQISQVNSDITNSVQTAIDDINKQMSKTKPTSKGRAAASAVMKGAKTTTQNHSIKYLDNRIKNAINSVNSQRSATPAKDGDRDVLR